MKIPHILLAVILGAAPAASAQTRDSKQPPATAAKSAEGSVEQTLMTMERDATAALLKRDTAAFGRLFAEDAVLTTPDGTVQSKPQLLADVKSGDLALESSEITDMKVQVYGDSAVVTYSTTDKGKYKGQDIGGRYRWTDVFVRRAETWQIVASQGTRIPQPPR